MAKARILFLSVPGRSVRQAHQAAELNRLVSPHVLEHYDLKDAHDFVRLHDLLHAHDVVVAHDGELVRDLNRLKAELNHPVRIVPYHDCLGSDVVVRLLQQAIAGLKRRREM